MGVAEAKQWIKTRLRSRTTATASMSELEDLRDLARSHDALLDACKWLFQAHEQVYRPSDDTLDKARTAIAEAEGEKG